MPDLLLELLSEEIPARPCTRSEARMHKQEICMRGLKYHA